MLIVEIVVRVDSQCHLVHMSRRPQDSRLGAKRVTENSDYSNDPERRRIKLLLIIGRDQIYVLLGYQPVRAAG